MVYVTRSVRCGYMALLSVAAVLSGCRVPPDLRGFPRTTARYVMRARKLLRTITRHGGVVGETREAGEARGRLTLQLGKYVIPELVKQFVNPPPGPHVANIGHIIGELSAGWDARTGLKRAVAHELGEAASVDSKLAGLNLFRSYPSEKGLPIVLGLLDDESPRVRIKTISALCSPETRYYGITHADKLVSVLLDADALVARRAAFWLKSLAHPRVLRLVVDTLPEITDPAVAREARMLVWSIEDRLRADDVPNGTTPAPRQTPSEDAGVVRRP